MRVCIHLRLAEMAIHVTMEKLADNPCSFMDPTDAKMSLICILFVYNREEMIPRNMLIWTVPEEGDVIVD